MEVFIEKIRTLSKRVEGIRENISTEEATKTSIIMPFFNILGYDVFNPMEFMPEFTADVGIKKGEKVDYAILIDKKPVILVEAKSINEILQKHDSQLFRYFGTSEAKFGILTNGIIYRFYTDLDEKNKMDSTPFFEFDLLELKDSTIRELYKFRKENFDLDKIFSTASDLKYLNKIKCILHEIIDNPSEDFVRFITNIVYEGTKTKNVLDYFNVLVARAVKQYINELVNEKINTALKSTSSESTVIELEASEEMEDVTKEPRIVTTIDELQSFAIIQLLLNTEIEEERLFYRDTQSYFNVLLDDNIRKWICRLFFNNTSKSIQFNDENRTTIKFEKISDIANYKDQLIDIVQKFI